MDEQKIVIIGAGIMDISALRRVSENKRFLLTCFERNYDLGGLWVYTNQTENDVYGRKINSAMYSNLQTNLPKQLMQLEGFPMDKECPSFPTYTDVLSYIRKGADQCDIRKYIKFNTEVQLVKPVSEYTQDTKWLITYGDNRKKNDSHVEEFDDVIVCNGNCSIPNYPIIDNEKEFGGLVIHSIRYRRPELFAGINVAVLGASHSGMDICHDVSKHPRKVYLCHRGSKLPTLLPANVIEKTSGFKRDTSSSIILDDNDVIQIDAVIYCTGVRYDFSFLPEGILEVGQNGVVCNIYKYILPRQYSTIFFMGLVRLYILFFPYGDHEASYIKAMLEGSVDIPAYNERIAVIDTDYKRPWLYNSHWEWDRELASIAGNFEPFQPVLKKIRDHVLEIKAKDFFQV
ncbi:Hypothetical predicted protein [Mytilus galloprovincialis]|uniref:Flavin-containing monooxygenase n=1 Tax=Mytilus galloprovincialis TaxID=29158 RepID=A0A8B6EWT1_MYTGA|nr:Hypothetical predicted protein [Mytilus galloprovincialis]